VLFLAVAWPTFFMGVSLPLLARALTPQLEAAARVVGLALRLEHASAAASALDHLAPAAASISRLLQIGAAINGACAASVLPLRRALGSTPSGDAVPAVASTLEPSRRDETGRRWLLLYASPGAVALSLEIAWFRTLGVALKSTSFTFERCSGSICSAWGAAAWWARAVARDGGRPAARFLALQGAIAPTPLSRWRCWSRWSTAGAASVALAPLPERRAAARGPRAHRALLHGLGSWTRDASGLRSRACSSGCASCCRWRWSGPPTFLMGLSFRTCNAPSRPRRASWAGASAGSRPPTSRAAWRALR
jgi:hypothetical protein